MRRTLIAAVCLPALGLPLAAQTVQPDTEGGRFILRRVDDGLMRVDRSTGTTSFCRKRDAGWTCQLVADDREALEGEIARLSRENSELAIEIGRLRERIAVLEARQDGERETMPAVPPSGEEPKAGGEGESGERTLRLPSDQEIDQVMKTFESMMRRFLDSMKILRERYEDDRT